ncbi:hypothetical protein Gorai_000389, partial [Gossypium raimondii]|nr:hypothetical protein [Gossypium raimondii]
MLRRKLGKVMTAYATRYGWGTGIRTRKCLRAIKSHDDSRVYGQARSKKDKLESKKDKLESKKDKLESSEFKENSVCKGNYEEKIAMETTIMRYQKSFVLLRNENSERGVKRFGSNASGIESNEAKENKKSVECFLCGGLHRLRNYPKKWASTQGRGELSSDLGEKLVMQILKLGPMRLSSGKATELTELSERLSPKEEELPPMGNVSCASDFGKVEAEGLWVSRNLVVRIKGAPIE